MTETVNELRADQILREIVQWAAATPLPAWQQDALRRLYQKSNLSEIDHGELLLLCKKPHKLLEEHEETPDEQPLTEEHLPEGGSPLGSVVSLHSLKEVTNVNALAAGQTLKFKAAGLTVIFGGNGSGKSGYSRILKQACRARSEEQILHNVFRDVPSSPASGTIVYTDAGQQLSYGWTDGGRSPDALSKITVFDSKCAAVQVDQKNAPAYLPLPLSLLHGLAEACKKLRVELQSERDSLSKLIPPTLRNAKTKPGTAVSGLLASLSGRTSPGAARSLSVLTPDEVNQLAAYRAAKTDPELTKRRLQNLLRRLGGVTSRLEAASAAFSEEHLERFRIAREDASAKAAAAKAASAEAFSKEPLTGMDSDAWRALWDAARTYSETEAYPGIPFPNTEVEARCLLCQRELDGPSSKRLLSFEEFVKNKARTASDEAQQLLDDLRGELENSLPAKSDRLEDIAFLRDEVEDVHLANLLTRSYADFSTRRRRAMAGTGSNRQSLPSLLPKLHRLAADFSKQLQHLAEVSRSEESLELQDQLAELEDRVWLGTVLDDVLKEIKRQELLESFEAAIADTRTGRITRKSSEVADALVKARWCSRFKDELRKLGVDHLAVDLRRDAGDSGTARFSIVLNQTSGNISPKLVLSEGEYRCIALAGCLSELSTTEDRSGIIFDDPISSLDHDHRDQVAKRLVEEAIQRQVIVFTHDIPFLFMLDRASRAANVAPLYQTISSVLERKTAGFCSAQLPFHYQPVRDAVGGLKTYFEQTRNLHMAGRVEEWNKCVDTISMRLRKCWEAAVAEILSPVVERFHQKVDTARLIAVTALTEADVLKMREAYRRCSELHHDGGPALMRPLADPDSIAAEIDALDDWLEQVLNKQQALLP